MTIDNSIQSSAGAKPMRQVGWRWMFVLVIVPEVLKAQGIMQRHVVVKPDERPVVVTSNVPYKPGSPTALLDVYKPTDAATKLPAVMFVHGGPTGSLKVSAKDIGQYQSYGRLVASRGFAAVTFTHGFSGFETLDAASADVVDAIAFVRSRADQFNIDADRLCIWAISGAGTVLAQAIRDAGPFLRCVLAYYMVADPSGFGAALPAAVDVNRHSVTAAVSQRNSVPPILVARAGKDSAALNRSLDLFLQAAIKAGASVDLYSHPTGMHAFDILDDRPRSRQIIEQSLAFVSRHLGLPTKDE